MKHKSDFSSPFDQNQPPLGQSLKTLLKAVLRFMVQRPQESVQSPTIPPQERYSAKASLYAYLPNSEEQRDWLEQLYHNR